MPHYTFRNEATVPKYVGIKKKNSSSPSVPVKGLKRPRKLNDDIPIDELQELLRQINAKLSKNKFGRGRNPFLEVIWNERSCLESVWNLFVSCDGLSPYSYVFPFL